jgi:hypothetical protein
MRRVISNALALVMLTSGILISPDTVLCLGPHHHCHLEVVVGSSCNNDPPGARGSAPGPSDGCPRGSKDFRLSVDSHRIDNSRVLAAPAAMLFAISGRIRISDGSSLRPSYPGSLVAWEPQHSEIVLRC